MGCGECMAKFGLVTFNIIFLLSGIAVLGVGIWLKVDKNVVNMQTLVEFDKSDKSLDTAAWVLIGFGSFVFLVSALGFLAACCCENKRKLFAGLYIAFLVIIFIGEFAGGITAAVFKGKIDDTLPGILSKTFKDYDSQLVAKAWDYMQVWLECCGSKGIQDYKDVEFNKTTAGGIAYSVPYSCCKLSSKNPEKPVPVDADKCEIEAAVYDIIPLPNNLTSVHVNAGGCYDSLNTNIKSHLVLIIGVGVGIGMFQLLGIVMACCFCKRDKNNLPY